MCNLKKVYDDFVKKDGVKTDTRFIRFESDNTDFKVCVSFHPSGYIDVSASLRSFLDHPWRPIGAPQIHIIEDNDCNPLFAEAHIPSAHLCAADMADLILYATRVKNNLDAINEIIQALNAGERFLD